ncbi:BTAD domain-containing putative transcriptional regulator [Actinoplanes sp. NPDC023801]|uniref:AfsR/SARP family transcriptional regulator n=1 Tax=Actinoplanes sp. NPDC023801 TaxID=3154595 RepID=UPI003407DC71
MITVRLLGRPAVEGDGRPVRLPRGRKTWALLGYLLLAERPPSRKHLAELLFADAGDPLGALRWALAELRRALDGAVTVTGDPVSVTTGPEVVVDVLALSGAAAAGDPLADGELLEGVDLASCLEYESWLLVARHRMSATVEARLRETAAGLLAQGRADAAVGYAQRAVSRNPLEETNHELLVRSLAVSGDATAAQRQIAVCRDLLRRELGIEASPSLSEAADVGTGSSMVSPVGGRAAAINQLEAGQAAIAAGAVDAGVQCLRRAVVEAESCHDDALRGRALLALGAALVHAVRGRDEEGGVVLHEAIAHASRAGDRATAASAHRELGFVEVQAGRRETADGWLAKAQALAGDDKELAAVLGVRGMNASDRGDYPTALACLRESAERAERAAARRQHAWTLAILARAHVLRGEHSQARHELERSTELIRADRWLALLPWNQAFSGELRLLDGDLGGAGDELEQSWGMACQIGDPCWEAVAARGLGRLSATRGRRAESAHWFGEAAARSVRVSDRYQWVRGYVLDAAAATAIQLGDPGRARPLVGTLAELAARCDMRELTVRAQLHRFRLGDRGALAGARLLGAGIDNPALARMLTAAVSTPA